MNRLILIALLVSTTTFGSHIGEVQKYIDKALESERIGKEKDAISYLTEALKLDGNNVKALTERASLYSIFDDYDNALKDYRKAIKLKPSEDLYYRVGVAELHSGDDEKAIQHFTKAISLNDEEEFYYFFRAEAKFDLGKYKEAMVDYNKAIELQPKDFRAIYKRGLCFFNLHDYNGALTDFNKAIQFCNFDTDIYYYRGATFFSLGKYERAIQDFTVALHKDPENHDALLNRAICYEYQSRYEEADIDYTMFSKENDMCAQLCYAAANIKFFLEDFDGAEQLYSKVIEKEKNNKLAYFHRGMARLNQEKVDLACSDFTKSRDLGYLAGFEQMKGNCK